MGRKKLYHKRYLIGLDKAQSMKLEFLSNAFGISYSDVVAYLMDFFQANRPHISSE